jgi:hypothetical protein
VNGATTTTAAARGSATTTTHSPTVTKPTDNAG